MVVVLAASLASSTPVIIIIVMVAAVLPLDALLLRRLPTAGVLDTLAMLLIQSALV